MNSHNTNISRRRRIVHRRGPWHPISSKTPSPVSYQYIIGTLLILLSCALITLIKLYNFEEGIAMIAGMLAMAGISRLKS